MLNKSTSRPTLGVNGHNVTSHSDVGLDRSAGAEDSDAVSVGSGSVVTNASASVNRRLERTLELDVSSLDSVNSGLPYEEGRKVKKDSKKKKFLPKFLQSNKKVKSL